jgi:hypothetical protein
MRCDVMVIGPGLTVFLLRIDHFTDRPFRVIDPCHGLPVLWILQLLPSHGASFSVPTEGCGSTLSHLWGQVTPISGLSHASLNAVNSLSVTQWH